MVRGGPLAAAHTRGLVTGGADVCGAYRGRVSRGLLDMRRSGLGTWQKEGRTNSSLTAEKSRSAPSVGWEHGVG